MQLLKLLQILHTAYEIPFFESNSIPFTTVLTSLEVEPWLSGGMCGFFGKVRWGKDGELVKHKLELMI